MAFGISIAFVLTFTFLPCVLYLINKSKTKDFLSIYKVTQFILSFSQNNKAVISSLFAITFITLCFGVSKLQVENRFIDYFDKDTENL